MDVFQGGNGGLEDWTAFFAGDSVGSEYFEDGLITNSVRQVIKSADLSIANLEAPIPGGDAISKSGPVLELPEQTPDALRNCGFDVVALANNHIMDYGSEGLSATQQACAEVGLDQVGVGDDRQSALQPFRTTIEDTDVAVFNLCQREFGIAKTDSAGTAWIGYPDVVNRVSEVATSADLVFVVAHGGIEYIPISPPRWQDKLRSFVDAGADSVIAHHPHVAQGWEVYNDAPIFYSLGNFLFHIPDRPSSEWGYCVQLDISGGEVTRASVILVEQHNGRIQRLQQRDHDKHEEYLTRISEFASDSPYRQGYWQELAVRLFDESYQHNFITYGQGHIQSLAENPIQELGRLLEGITSREALRQTQQIQMLNYIQHDTHKELIETALGVKTGSTEDKRTPQIKSEVDELFEWVDEQPEKGVVERNMERGKGLLEKLL